MGRYSSDSESDRGSRRRRKSRSRSSSSTSSRSRHRRHKKSRRHRRHSSSRSRTRSRSVSRSRRSRSRTRDRDRHRRRRSYSRSRSRSRSRDRSSRKHKKSKHKHRRRSSSSGSERSERYSKSRSNRSSQDRDRSSRGSTRDRDRKERIKEREAVKDKVKEEKKEKEPTPVPEETTVIEKKREMTESEKIAYKTAIEEISEGGFTQQSFKSSSTEKKQKAQNDKKETEDFNFGTQAELSAKGGKFIPLSDDSLFSPHIQAASANISPRGGTLVQGLYYENPQRVRFSGAAVAIPLTYELDNFIGTVDLDTVEKTLLNMAPLMKSKFPDLGNSVTFSTYVQELKFRTTNVVRVIRKVKWELDKLNYISVSKSKPQRNKRGLINLMGEISKTLFGTATDTDLADVRNMVNRLTSKVEEQEFLNDKIISATAAAVDKLNTNVQHIVDHVNDLTHFINSLSVDFKHFADFTLLLENLTLMASDLRSNIMSFKAGLALLDTGVLDPFLFPPDIMVEVVQKLVTLGYNVPSPPTYTHNQLYDIVRVQASHPQYNAISVVLLIPILEHPMFNIRRVHSVPTFMSESVTTAWESYPVLISTGTQSLATHLTHWPDCTHGVCYGSLNLASPTEICEAAVLFLNSTTTCARTMTRRNSKTAFQRVTGGYFYSVAPSASLTLRQVCINDSIQIPLKGDGYLPAQAGCSYVGHHTYLSASGVVNVAGQQPIAFQPPFSLSKPVLDLNEKAIPEDFLAPLMADDVPVPEAQLRALHQLAALPSGPHWRLSTYGGLSASTTALVLIFGAIAVAILLYCRLRRRLPPSPSPQTAQRSAEFALSSLRFGRGLQDLRSLRSGHEEPSLDPHVYASVAHSVNEATNNYD